MADNEFEGLQRRTIDTRELPPVLTIKWPKSILREGFVPFPKRLLRCVHQLFTDDDGLEELATLLAIIDYRRPNLSRLPSITYLAFAAGIPVKHFKRTVNRLKARGWVEIEGTEDAIDIKTDGFMEAIRKAAPPAD